MCLRSTRRVVWPLLTLQPAVRPKASVPLILIRSCQREGVCVCVCLSVYVYVYVCVFSAADLTVLPSWFSLSFATGSLAVHLDFPACMRTIAYAEDTAVTVEGAPPCATVVMTGGGIRRL